MKNDDLNKRIAILETEIEVLKEIHTNIIKYIDTKVKLLNERIDVEVALKELNDRLFK